MATNLWDDEYNARLEDIRANPDAHHHTFDGLVRCSLMKTHSGPCGDFPTHDRCEALDLQLFDAHERFAPVKLNGPGRNNCDVIAGKCACGLSH
jgi:hypothetical protein